MKKTFIILLCSSLAMACGNSTDTKSTEKKDAVPAATDSSATATPGAADEKGLELIGSSDCITCHKLREKNIGPAYSDVAEKYRNTPHAVDTLIQKVIHGGSGNWGPVPMTPHPALPESDIRTMVTYILTLKK
jgi:cytochrome c